MSSLPQSKRLSDYHPPGFTIDHIHLTFELADRQTVVTAVSQVKRLNKDSTTLTLDGVNLTLLSVVIDGQSVTDYQQSDNSLTLNLDQDQAELVIKTQISPADNSSLEGLYKSGGAFCTQCEAEGFRKITYYLDRPDVLAKFDVKVIADKSQYPMLLSNGNRMDSGELDGGRHWVSWQDPFNKPCYLFALVAGDFDLLVDNFSTASGRDVRLELYVDKGNLHRGQHALDSLKKSMAWDEEVFGLEYDLDIYMIVAVDFFNMGAMENKGLNIFNSKYVLADAASATDEDYFNIESVIAHEYFHNWTGNRVTCRDWFQLSLKEGLTVFRDQQFSNDMASAAVNRINNVRVIREHQFAEDASPMAHPIRPEEVIEMNNFYTVTVYNKGAEVIRMMHTILGQQGFRKGMDLYFQRFDGQAVTCDDFVQSMEDATGEDLQCFRRWYSQSGTPELKVRQRYNADNHTLTLSLSQHTPATADQSEKQPLHLPLSIELVSNNGNALPVNLRSHHIDFKDEFGEFELSGVEQDAVAYVLCGFSAPVRLDADYSDDDLSTIMLNASDEFARWDAGQQLLTKHILAIADDYQPGQSVSLPKPLKEAIAGLLQDTNTDPALIAEMLTLPSFETLCQSQQQIDVDGLYWAQSGVKQALADELYDLWLSLYQQQQTDAYRYEQKQVCKRRLRNICLEYLAASSSAEDELLLQQYQQADNMSDTLGALKASQSHRMQLFDQLMADFEQTWQQDPLVLDKWFGLHAGAERKDILSRLDLLQAHKGFSINNPNRVRALMGSFAFYNVTGFHAADGSGYKYLTDYLIKLNGINPQVAARLVTPLIQWRRYDPSRQQLMQAQLLRLAGLEDLSTDLYEKVSRSLT